MSYTGKKTIFGNIEVAETAYSITKNIDICFVIYNDISINVIDTNKVLYNQVFNYPRPCFIHFANNTKTFYSFCVVVKKSSSSSEYYDLKIYTDIQVPLTNTTRISNIDVKIKYTSDVIQLYEQPVYLDNNGNDVSADVRQYFAGFAVHII